MGLRHMAGRCGLPSFVRLRLAGAAVACSAVLLAATEPGCTSGATGPQRPCPTGQTCEVRLTLLHTSDIHSRIFPYDLQVLQIDSELGLGTLDEVKDVGGVARVSYVVNRERARADRVLHLDSGDIFEGAPIFNYFQGEPETRAESDDGYRCDGHRESRVRRRRAQRPAGSSTSGRTFRSSAPTTLLAVGTASTRAWTRC